jgi:hypothetical protein
MPTKYTAAFEKVAIQEYIKTRDDIDSSKIAYANPPDTPPDCVAGLKNGHSIWIEARSIYRHDKLAENLNKELTNEVFGETISETTEFQSDLIEAIKKAIIEKDDKSSYEKVKSAYGKGILLLYLDDPLAGSEDIDAIINFNNYCAGSLRNFHSVCLYVRPVYSFSNGEWSFRGGISILFSDE